MEAALALPPPHASDPFFEYSQHILELQAEKTPDRQPWIALLASQKWPDTDWLSSFVDKLVTKYPRATIIHTGRLGAQATLVDRVHYHGLRGIEVQPDPGAQAKWKPAVKAMHVLWLADIVMCFWGGTADSVKSTIDKALMTHRPEPRFYPGLHVYEVQRTRKTRSTTARATGKIKHRTRHSFDLLTPEQATDRIPLKGRL